MRSHLRPTLVLLGAMTLLLGIAYPAFVTLVARIAFPAAASGSLIHRDGGVIGSALIGQSFASPRYFWGRPSATAPQPYNGLASGGSNLGPLNPALLSAVDSQVSRLRQADPAVRDAVPVELVTASASGLDPDLSEAGARFQVGRVASARGLPSATVDALVTAHVRGRVLGFLGERTVNVLELNLALDALR
ncbi:MAG: potassium-transporting ATPase subunit KdpC [Proteobacteria bacterium]|nr:potassium-transporting ATPase subunit KdpC [Pseudomonadota bacterium]